MGSLSDHVVLSITQDSVGLTRAGFGVAGILSVNAAWAERSRTYSDLAGVAADFAATSPEYLAAQALLSQSPHPSSLKILRAVGKPTLVYTCGVVNIKNSHTYQIRVVGEGVTTTTVEFTSDASALNDEIVAGIVAQLELVAGKNFTAAVVVGAGDTDTFTVTGDAAGDWFSLEVLDVTDLKVSMTHAEPATTLATDLDAIVLEDDEWYALYTLYNSEAYVLAAAAWVESQMKIYVADTNETNAIILAAGGSDLLQDLDTANRARTAGIYHGDPSEMIGAAWLGRCLPLDPGSETWKFKTLAGISADQLTATHRTNLLAKDANGYYDVAGVSMTFEGTTSDGDYIDVQRGLDWLTDDMTKAVFGALAGANKIPYTDAGVAVIENEVRGSLKRAIGRGILAGDPEPVITVPLVADVASVDKTARLLPDVKWSATLAGAIHKVNISGVVSV